MERVTDAKKIQGSGSGERFQDPEQLQNQARDYQSKIQKDIFLHTRSSAFKEDKFDTIGNNDKEIWKTQLYSRLKHLSGSIGGETSTLNSISPVPKIRVLNEPKAGPMRQHIPGLPTNIEDLIHLWSKGSPTLGFRPAFMDDSAERREILIPGYKNANWVSSGQKRANQRLKAFAKAVSKCNDNISDMFCRSCDSAWKTAVQASNEKWSLKQSKKKLSSLEAIVKNA